MDNTKTVKRCLLDENKVCDDCGECDRCDLDPNKLCDNCCKCLALEDADSEFRTVTLDGKHGFMAGKASPVKPKAEARPASFSAPIDGEPYELTPELVAYWESKLAEYGEAPADDGFGEIEVCERIPVKGSRRIGQRHAEHFEPHKHSH